MNVWLAGQPAPGRVTPDRIRIQIVPFDNPAAWERLGWELRAGSIFQRDWQELGTTTDEVRVEQIHQETWLRAARAR